MTQSFISNNVVAANSVSPFLSSSSLLLIKSNRIVPVATHVAAPVDVIMIHVVVAEVQCVCQNRNRSILS